MIRNDMDCITDEEYEKVVVPCYNKIQDYFKSTFLDEYVAFNIATYYKHNALWNEPFEIQVNTAIEDLQQITVEDCDLKRIKQILESKYKLKIVKEEPIDIEELDFKVRHKK